MGMFDHFVQKHKDASDALSHLIGVCAEVSKITSDMEVLQLLKDGVDESAKIMIRTK